MVAKNSKLNACKPNSQHLHIVPQCNRCNDADETSNSKSCKPKVPIKPTEFQEFSTADESEYEPTDGTKAPQKTSRGGHVADSCVRSCADVALSLIHI